LLIFFVFDKGKHQIIVGFFNRINSNPILMLILLAKLAYMMSRIEEKLSILADAAKYDVSCASSGSKRRNSGGIGDATGMGICHAYSEDGRCVSLLKILLTNHCIYDCAYCVSRRSNDVKRAAFTVEEVVELTIQFYKRNYIEGLFLSSGIFKDPDYTMERLVRIAKTLRLEHRFNGYIHLKTIPGASENLLTEAGLYADRLSVNIELPSKESLSVLAPDKKQEDFLQPMRFLRDGIAAHQNQKLIGQKSAKTLPTVSSMEAFHEAQQQEQKSLAALSGQQKWDLIRKSKLFAPAGQSTQMIIGASSDNDGVILTSAWQFYKQMNLKRVYYSGYVPISTDLRLPAIGTPVPMVRENRLYQADWLMRFYGFDVSEILPPDTPHLDLSMDPKLAWALRNMHLFPVDLKTAPYELLIRVPGLGRESAYKIVQARKFGAIRSDFLKSLKIPYQRVQYFIQQTETQDWRRDYSVEQLKTLLAPKQTSKAGKASTLQLNLFSS